MATVYVYVMETMADWEAAHVMAELYSKRFFKKDAKEIVVKTVGASKNSIHSMGGLCITPDITVEEMSANPGDMLILPGSDLWANPENHAILGRAKEFLDQKLMVAAICGATVALASAGMLDERPHTSNGAGFLEMFCPNYKGEQYFVDMPAVKDDNLITAGATGGILFAKYILDALDVMKTETLESWYAYFTTGKAEHFFAMMQSVM